MKQLNENELAYVQGGLVEGIKDFVGAWHAVQGSIIGGGVAGLAGGPLAAPVGVFLGLAVGGTIDFVTGNTPSIGAPGV